MNKTSIYYWDDSFTPMEVRFKLIKKAGFDEVVLWWWNEEPYEGDKYTFPGLARREGLFIENIHAPYGGSDTLWLDNAEGEAFYQTLAQCINECADFEIPTIVIHPTSGDEPLLFNQTGLDRFKRLVDIAEKRNVVIALENLIRTEYLDFIFSNIQSEKLGFCYDSGHNNCYTKGLDLLSKHGSKLAALHLHDNDGTDDQHKLPFEGNIDWSNLMKQIKKTGYKGAVSLEVLEDFKESNCKLTEEYLIKAHKTAVKLMDLMNN